MKAVMYGAGNIGRGFIGQLLFRSGYETAFVDVNKTVLDLLNAERRYPVRTLFHEGSEEEMITGVRGVDGNDIDAVASAIAEVDIMATAVGVNVLKFIARPIAAGLTRRYEAGGRPLDIIICENLLEADKYLRGLIGAELADPAVRSWFERSVGLVEASIGRMVPIQTPAMQDGNPLRVCVEAYATLPVDREAFRGPVPPIVNLTPFSPFAFYIERKLFIHNMGHALTAYLGDRFGDECIWQAVGRPEVELLALRAMTESAMALSKRHGVPFPEVYDHVEDLLHRFGNRQLGDTVERVGRDLRRKLSANDRMIGALNSCLEAGLPCKYICLGIAAALRFSHDPLPGEMDPAAILTGVGGLDPASVAYALILDLHDRLANAEDLASVAKHLKTVNA